MANAYTTNLKLNQWAASDSFVRTEFNRDNQILEEAFTNLDSRTGLLEGLLEPMGYNLYQSVLQNYYDGKETSFKKSLIFDGFRDTSMISTVGPGAYHDAAARTVRVLSHGSGNIDTGFCVSAGATGDLSSTKQYEWISWSGSDHTFVTTEFTPSGYGVLNSVTLRLAQGYLDNTNRVKVELMAGNTVLATSSVLTVNHGNTAKDYTFSFPSGFTLKGLTAYQLRITNVGGSYYLCLVKDSAQTKIGIVCAITPKNYTTGTITTPMSNIGRNYNKAFCWVRHSGTVGVLVKGNSGSYLSLTKIATRQAKTLQGQACTETYFRLDAAPAIPNNQVTVKLELNTGGAACVLYDYGLLLL